MAAGLYIHVPFCQKRCHYCDFFSTTRLEARESYIHSLLQEAKLRQNYLQGETLTTLYIGGGTPSLLSENQLQTLFQGLARLWDVSHIEECTLECNPDDVHPQTAQTWKKLPLNRISMGVQSLREEELQLLGRRHNKQQVLQAINDLKNAGFENISIDLMYALPGQSLEHWADSLQQAIALQVPHLSAYCLSFEENTPLYAHRAEAPDEETQEAMYRLLCRELRIAGYEHYEISNFALPGYRSRHNQAYWQEKKYLGLGAGAHSYNGKERSWNCSNLQRYLSLLQAGKTALITETLSENDRYNEMLLTALRTSEGINKHRIPAAYQTYFQQKSLPFIQQGLLCEEKNFIRLSEKGIFVSDFLLRELIH